MMNPHFSYENQKNSASDLIAFLSKSTLFQMSLHLSDK